MLNIAYLVPIAMYRIGHLKVAHKAVGIRERNEGIVMGLSRAAIAYLMNEGKRREFTGSVLTLGVQGVFMTEEQYETLARDIGFKLAPAPAKPGKAPLFEGRISSDYALTRLGFQEVVATDVDGFEEADFLFDLNDDDIPDAHRAKYDLVIDSGTLEHVFNVPNALRNIVNFASDGGRILHLAPSSNHIDHGFYMFSPTLFWDFYSANEQEIISCELFRYPMPEHDTEPWIFGKYIPGSLGKFSMGGLGGGCFGVAALIERTRAIGKITVPQQGMYVSMWSDASTPANTKQRQGLRKAARTIRTSVGAFRRKFHLQLPSHVLLRFRAFMKSFPLKIDRSL